MNTIYFTRGFAARMLAAVALFSLIAGLVPMQAFAAHDPFGGVPQTSVKICHTAGNSGNYVVNEPNISSTGGNISFSGGHAGHGNNTSGDVIPPFHFNEGTTTVSYAGKNWSASTEDIWASGNCTGDGIVGPTTGTLTINKIISGIGGILTSAFSFVVNGGSSVAFELDGSNSVSSVPAGAYTVVEAGVAGGEVVVGPNTYSVGYSGCSGTLAAAGNAVCTITNTFVPPAPVPGCMDIDANNYSRLATVDNGSCLFDLVVNKVVTASTSPNYAMFSFKVDGGASIPFEVDGSNVVVVSSTTHSVVEDAEVGFTTSYGNCTDVVVTGGDAVCTITNTPVGIPTGTLNVVKMVVGTTTVDESAFSFKLDGGATTTFETDGTNSFTLVAGTYDVVETSAPGYTTTYSNCDNVVVTAGQTSTCTITNTLIVPGPTTCTVVIVSNTSDFVVEKSANAVVPTFIHALWTATLGSASWIWGDDPIATSTGDVTQTFRKQFGFVGNVTNATLEVASDNGHSATLNGTSTSNGGSTFGSPVSYNMTSAVLQGSNELLIAVTNDGAVVDTTSNPAGLMYRLTIQGEVTDDADCATPYVPPVDVCTNIDGLQTTVPDGFSANDGICTRNGGGNDDLSCSITASDTSIREGRDVTIDWSAVGASSATITNIAGPIALPAGSHYIANLEDTTTFTMTVMDEQENTASCSVTVSTRNSSGGGGGGSNNNNDDEPEGDVLGDSDDRPEGEVLGDQVDAVPTGAPNAGAGGTSHSFEFFSVAPVAIVGRTRKQA